jgi:hypothetical protein
MVTMGAKRTTMAAGPQTGARAAALGLLALLAMAALATSAAATAGAWADVPCSILHSIKYALENIVPTLVALMFVYGGLKYTYSVDDPGGRKTGKNICIQSIFGGLLFALVYAMGNAVFAGATHLGSCW